MNTDVRVAIAFEGVGVDPYTETEGYAFGYGDKPAGASGYTWVDSLTSFPSSVDTTVNPATGEFQLSLFVFELHNNDLEAMTFLYQQRDKQATLLEDSGTTIQLDRDDMDFQVIYVGNETIQIGTFIPAIQKYQDCVRGVWGSTEERHSPGSHVYTKIPKLRGRGVKLLTFAGDEPSEVRWRGYIDTIETSDDGTIVKIMCREHLLVLKGAKINRGAEEVKNHRLSILSTITTSGVWHSITGVISARSTVELSPLDAVWSTYFQVDDALVQMDNRSGPSQWSPPSGAGGRNILLDSGPKMLSGLKDVDRRTETPIEGVSVYEVFFVGKGYYPPTDRLKYPYHPLSIAAALLLSGNGPFDRDNFNILQKRWGAGLRSLFGPSFVADMHAMIEDTWNLEVDFFLLGWDGQSEDLLTVINTKLLRPYGFYFGITDDGLLTIKRFGLFSVLDFDEAIQNTLQPLMSPLVCKFDPAMGSAVDGISATVGEKPWRKGDSFLVNIEGGDADTERLQDAARWTVDFSTVSSENSQQVISKLLGMSTLAAFAMPRITIRVDDGRLAGVDLGLGELCLLKDIPIDKSYFIDRDGNRLDTIEGLTEFAGIIIGRQFNVPNQTYLVTLLLTNFRGGLTRLRAPSAVAIFELGGFIYLKNEFSDDEASEFNIGDQVIITDESLSVLSTGHDVISIGPGYLDISNPPIFIDDGSIIRLAPFDDYTNRPRVGNTSLLAYNFIGTHEEHIYG